MAAILSFTRVVCTRRHFDIIVRVLFQLSQFTLEVFYPWLAIWLRMNSNTGSL